MTDIDDEICGLCREKINFCPCWRCMECEQLHVWADESTENDDGEQICLECSG